MAAFILVSPSPHIKRPMSINCEHMKEPQTIKRGTSIGSDQHHLKITVS